MMAGSGIPMEAFGAYAERKDDSTLLSRWLFSQELLAHPALLRDSRIFCCICGEVTSLAASDPAAAIDAREGLHCAKCGMSARQRAGVALLWMHAGGSDSIYVTEQSTRLYAWLQSRHGGIRGSEFEPDPVRRAEMAAYLASMGGSGEIAFEDVTRLSMADASQDVVLSFDVLEHVPDYRAALREFARVLRVGGSLLATFPFTDAASTVVRASLLDDGTLKHHLEPEYHGDPIGGPVLCFYHFGWDLLDELRAAGFTRAAMAMPWAPEQGILYGHWTLVATR
jgi:SAM-dependent methyltransferase